MTATGWCRRIGTWAKVTFRLGLAVPLVGLAAFAFMAIPSSPVHAAGLGTCTWNGNVNTDLSVGGNWTSGNARAAVRGPPPAPPP